MQKKFLDDLFYILLTLFVIISCFAIGITYDDNLWKSNLDSFSNNHIEFKFSINADHYYVIEKHFYNDSYTINKYYNNSKIYNISLPKK